MLLRLLHRHHKPQGRAAINEIETLPLRSERGRSAYRAFLKAPKPKAFAIGQFGTWGWVSGRRDASDEALRFCASMSTLTCRIYAVDETVVWTADDGKDAVNATFIPLQEGGGAQGKRWSDHRCRCASVRSTRAGVQNIESSWGSGRHVPLQSARKGQAGRGGVRMPRSAHFSIVRSTVGRRAGSTSSMRMWCGRKARPFKS